MVDTKHDPFVGDAEAHRGTGSQPLLHQRGKEIQRFGELRLFPIALAHDARAESCQLLNQVLADSMILYNLYKKHHWLVRGPTFYQLHLLLDKHAEEQLKLIDLLGERVQTLGGVAIADPRHVAEVTTVPRPPDGVEEVPAMLSRLLEAHEIVIEKVRDAITATAGNRDDGSNDLLMSEVLRTNELQVWFVAEHLVNVPVVRLDQPRGGGDAHIDNR
jgi:starvation-inducible DNA-binding protein